MSDEHIQNPPAQPPTRPTSPKLPLTELQHAVERLRGEVRKVIVGQEKMVDLLLVALLSDGHVLIEGAPGLAKTLDRQAARDAASTRASRASSSRRT